METLKNAPSHWQYLFWSRVEVGDVSECWRWRGCVNRDGGYGVLQAYAGGVKLFAHRVAYALHQADPGADHVLHRCDTPTCCNPFHLVLGSHAENMADMAAKGRAARNANFKKGEAHWNSKLNEADILRMKGLIADGWRNKDIAPLFGVQPHTVSRIRHGHYWKAVTQDRAQ